MLRRRLTRLVAAGIVIAGSVYSALVTDLHEVAVIAWVSAFAGLLLAMHALCGDQEPER